MPEVKSISRSTTTKHDLEGNEEVWRTFVSLSESISKQLIESDFLALKLSVMLRDNTLTWESYTKPLSSPVRLSIDIAREAMSLFQDSYDWKAPLRSVGIAVSELIDIDSPLQMSFYSPVDTQVNPALEMEMLKIRERFGKDAIKKASVIGFDSNLNDYKSFS